MKFTKDVSGMLVLYLVLSTFSSRTSASVPPGANLPYLLLRRLLGDGIGDELDWTADDLLHRCNDIELSINDVRGS